jgi:hypothetical protein
MFVFTGFIFFIPPKAPVWEPQQIHSFTLEAFVFVSARLLVLQLIMKLQPDLCPCQKNSCSSPRVVKPKLFLMDLHSSLKSM